MAQTGPINASQASPIRMGRSVGRQIPGNSLRILQIDSHSFELHSISDAIDSAFDAIYRDILQNRSADWDLFTRAASDFLDSDPSPAEMDQFFEAAEPISFFLAEYRKIDAACDYWLDILGVITNRERQLSRQYHKGSGYFFWACSWFSRGDTDTGLLIMNKALIEDKRQQCCSNGNWPNSSAAMVVTLDQSLNLLHPASWWVGEQVQEIDDALDSANLNLRTSDIRSRLFLGSDTDLISLLIYSHSSILRIERLNLDHHDSKLLGSLALNHLFRITVIIENLLKARTGSHGSFMQQIQELSCQIGGQLKGQMPSQNGLQYASCINDQRKANASLLLRQLIDGTARYRDVGQTNVSNLDQPLCVAYVLRNIGAHDLDVPVIIAEEIHSLRVHVLATLVKCVEIYYP